MSGGAERVEPGRRSADAALLAELRPHLPKDFFRRSPGRLVYLAVAVAAVAAHLTVTRLVLDGRLSAGWAVLTLAAAAFTYPYFMLTMHELQHGAVLPRGPARELATWVAGFPLPFQPRFWRVMHLHHHVHSNQPEDTHRLRTVDEATFAALFVDFRLSNPITYVSAPFAVQAMYGYCLLRFLSGTVAYHISRGRVIFDLALHAVLAVAMVALIGWKLTLVGWIPLFILGNVLLNAYMMSQHLTRPMVNEPDSLRTSVSVWLWAGRSHMDFGRHTEHHLYPSVAANKLRPVAALLRERCGDAFREKPLLAALAELFSLPGYYAKPDVLTDRRARTLRPID